MIGDATMRLVTDAIAHARAKHGDRTIDHLPLHHRVSVLVEEVGEVARSVQGIDDSTRLLARCPTADDARSIDADRANLRDELAQVAACALMWLQEMSDDR